MKSWQEDTSIEMNSRHNEEKSAVAERFKKKKSKNVYIDN